jgi:hypothetical protein
MMSKFDPAFTLIANKIRKPRTVNLGKVDMSISKENESSDTVR